MKLVAPVTHQGRDGLRAGVRAASGERAQRPASKLRACGSGRLVYKRARVLNSNAIIDGPSCEGFPHDRWVNEKANNDQQNATYR
jgi:hypothetical protein